MSKDTNNFTLIGRLTRDAALKHTAGGMAIAEFSIAVNRQEKHGETWVDEPSFFDMAIFGKRAEGLAPYLLKGQQVAVNGELKQDRWEKDGQKNSKVAFQVNDLQLLGSGKNMREKVATPDGEEPKKQEAQRELGEGAISGESAVHTTPFEDDLIF